MPLLSTALEPVLLILGAALLALGLDRLPLPDFWYPETDSYQLWVLGVLALAVRTVLRRNEQGRRHWLQDGAWLLCLALCLYGLLNLARHAASFHTTGDLYQNYLEGARRFLRGEVVYDQVGLAQSVNATPLALLLALPLAPLTNHRATAFKVAFDLLALGGFWASGCALIRRLKGSLLLSDIVLTLAAACTWNTLQRSVRLGQLDVLLLALLATAFWAWQAHRPRISGALLGLATALKLVPGLALLPWAAIGAASILRPTHDGKPSYESSYIYEVKQLIISFLSIIIITTLTVFFVFGARPIVGFAQNIGHISDGTCGGNNYSVSARLCAIQNPAARRGHHPLPPWAGSVGRGLAVATLVGLGLAMVWLRRADPLLLSSLSLASTPLISPVCWDIYLLWSSFLPWLVLLAHLCARPELMGRRYGQLLLGTALTGAYLLAGTAGNTTFRDLRTGVSVDLPLPAWFNELPLLGHFLLIVLIIYIAHRSQSRSERIATQADLQL